MKEVIVELLKEQSAGVSPELLVTPESELAARRSLRAQIGKLERELAEAFLTAAPMGGLDLAPGGASIQPRLLDLGELEVVRDELAERVRRARARISQLADAQEAARIRLERMLLEPGRYRFVRVTREELGEPGCGAWQARPRLGLIGMLMGWWQVKLSSGCPLPGGRGELPAARSGGRCSRCARH